MNNPMLVKLLPGGMAPTGAPTIYIDGEAYYAVDAAPSQTWQPYQSVPQPVIMDLSPIHHAIGQLCTDLDARLASHADAHREFLEQLVAHLDRLTKTLETRFEDIDQALRPLVDP